MILTHDSKSPFWRRACVTSLGLSLGLAATSLVLAAGCATGSGEPAAASQMDFKTPEEAAEALIVAAETFDVAALSRILGPDGVDLVVTGDPVHDRNQGQAFAAQARVKTEVVRDAGQPEARGPVGGGRGLAGADADRRGARALVLRRRGRP